MIRPKVSLLLTTSGTANEHLNPSRVEFQRGDIESIPAAAGEFEVVFCCDTVEHVLRPLVALRELRRVIKPDGVLVLTTPNYLSVLGLRRIKTRAMGHAYTEGGQPVNNLTSWPRTKWWLRRAGFVVDRWAIRRFGDLTAVRCRVYGR